MYVFDTPIFPFKKPQRNLEATAIVKVGEKPNRMTAAIVPPRPLSSANLLPYLSATTPQKILPKMLPLLKAAPTSVSVVQRHDKAALAMNT